MTRSARSICALVVAAQALLPWGEPPSAGAESALLYNGFGAAAGFTPGGSIPFGVLARHAATVDRDLAVPFSIPDDRDYYLETIDVAMTSASGGRLVELRILGGTRGTGDSGPNEAYVLERTLVTVPPRQERAGPPGPESIVRVTLSRGPTLRAGRRYWLAVSASPSSRPAALEWWQAAVQPTGIDRGIATRTNLGPWEPSREPGPALRLTGTPVAAPRRRAYAFTRIADTAGPFRAFPRPARVALNDAGTVVFPAQLDTGQTGIFTSTGGAPTRIAESGGLGEFVRLGAYPSINGVGLVAWRGVPNRGPGGIFLRSGRGWRPVVDEKGPFHDFGPAAINQAGAVAFVAGLAGQGGGVFTATGGTVVTVAHTSGPFAGFLGRPSINDKGAVAFSARLDSGVVGIYTRRGAAMTTIADTRGPLAMLRRPSLNDRGTVAFVACLTEAGAGCPFASGPPQILFTGNGGPLARIADSEGPFAAFGHPALNNAGRVAFVARLDSGHRGIYTGPDPVADRVLRTGDALLGAVVTDLGFVDGIGLNDAGTIAFYARLDDGTEGIYLATPIDPS